MNLIYSCLLHSIQTSFCCEFMSLSNKLHVALFQFIYFEKCKWPIYTSVEEFCTKMFTIAMESGYLQNKHLITIRFYLVRVDIRCREISYFCLRHHLWAYGAFALCILIKFINGRNKWHFKAFFQKAMLHRNTIGIIPMPVASETLQIVF